MKKYIYILILPAILLTNACTTINVSKIKSGLQTINKCCSSLSTSTYAISTLETSEDEKIETEQSSSLLPSDVWNVRMMIR